ncbi:MAG: xanthine dehydrogenase FAD-binding subunit XdhB [Campylobacteraceae bacterium]|nr:xanthine dehydrogenase FAD-binding subunit XdhB [Campylobacteraceae bacterium]
MYPIKSYTEAKTVKEAIEILTNNDNAMLIAGGTDVLIKSRELKNGYVDRDLVGVTRIEEIKGVKLDDEGNILIGAATVFYDIETSPIIQEHFSIVAQGVGLVGGPQIRNTGTIGGNLCNGAVSADSMPSLVCANAIMVIEGKDGKRELPIREFYIKPGVVDLKQGEMLTHVKITKENYEGFKGSYLKFAQRKAMDIATIGCGVLLKQKDGKVEDMRIAFGVAGPKPIRATQAEEFAKGKELTIENIEAICALCTKDTMARDSWRASKLFRENLITELPVKAIRRILGEKDA